MGQPDRDSTGQICPRPPGWKPSASVVACSRSRNARALSTGFRVAPTRVELPARCGPVAARRTLARALVAYNAGLGDDFAKRGLQLGVTYQGALVTKGAFAKLVLDCRSGLLEGWVGPALKTPPATK